MRRVLLRDLRHRLVYAGALAGMWICDAEHGAGHDASDGETVR